MEKENFKMYAMYVNEPYIVEEKDIPAFLENSEKQEKIVNQIVSMLGDEWFDFKKDENGYMAVTVNVECRN